MEGQENTPIEGLGESAQEALRQACAERGIDYDSFLETMRNVAAAIGSAIQEAAEAFEAIKSAISLILPPVVESLSICPIGTQVNWAEELFWMVPPHVKHLAHNHPKAKVRSKNWNRMWKIHERYMKCHKS